MEGKTENKTEQVEIKAEQVKTDSPAIISHEKPKYMLLEKVKRR